MYRPVSYRAPNAAMPQSGQLCAKRAISRTALYSRRNGCRFAHRDERCGGNNLRLRHCGLCAERCSRAGCNRPLESGYSHFVRIRTLLLVEVPELHRRVVVLITRRPVVTDELPSLFGALLHGRERALRWRRVRPPLDVGISEECPMPCPDE